MHQISLIDGNPSRWIYSSWLQDGDVQQSSVLPNPDIRKPSEYQLLRDFKTTTALLNQGMKLQLESWLHRLAGGTPPTIVPPGNFSNTINFLVRKYIESDEESSFAKIPHPFGGGFKYCSDASSADGVAPFAGADSHEYLPDSCAPFAGACSRLRMVAH